LARLIEQMRERSPIVGHDDGNVIAIARREHAPIPETDRDRELRELAVGKISQQAIGELGGAGPPLAHAGGCGQLGVATGRSLMSAHRRQLQLTPNPLRVMNTTASV
jgi:hypothetical protein